MTESEKLAGSVVALVALPFSLALEGFVLSRLWAWFAVPVFGLPALSVPQAIGVALIVALATYRRIPSDEHPLTRSLDHACVCLFFWGIGALVALFL